MTLKIKRFLTVGLCLSFSCSSLLSWGQNLRLDRALDRTVAAKMTTDQKQMRQALFNTFEYPAIIQALYQLHDFYNNPPLNSPEAFKHLANLPTQTALPDTVVPRPQISNLSLKNDVLEAISQHTLTPEELLNYIDPLNPTQNKFKSWQDTYYAATYLNSSLANTLAPYKGLEHFLRHAQMRVSYRLSAVPPLAQRDHLQTQAIAQLRLNLMMLHITYKRLYGKDPLESMKGPFPYARELQEVVVTGKGKAMKPAVSQTPELPTDGKSIYEITRSNFRAEIYSLKDLLPNQDRYSFTKFVEVLKGRNTTKQFSAKQAALNVAGDFFWINSIVDLGKWIFGDEDKTPMANLSALVPAAVEYELLQDRFSNIKQLVALLEPEKLAENKYGAIFKNDILYQNMQPVVLEVFNVLYGYAAAPGVSAQKRQQVLNLLAEFANPNQYSIMTRLSAISVAAKLVSLRQEATNPYLPANAQTDGTWAQVKLRGENPLPALGQNKAQQLYTRLQQGPAFADQMAQYIVDIYGTLTANSTLAGLHDYGLNATQMQQLADELARLYNIFAQETNGRYPRILAQGNVEEVWGYENGLRVKKLHYFGARVKSSWGQDVELFTHIATNPAKYEKDTQETIADLAVAVCSWKAMVGIYRLGKSGVQAAIRLTLPKATAQIIPLGAALGGEATPLTLQTALKAGIQADGATLARLQYVLDNPIPEITTRAELVKFLGLSETASDKLIKQTLRKLSLKYHPDRLVSVTSTRGTQYVSDQMARLNNLKDVMDGKGAFSAVVEQQARAAQEQARAAQAAEFETKSRFGKMADAAAEEAAKQTHYRAPDAHSWGRVAAAFAGWNVLDYGLSFMNTPLEEKMVKDAQNEYEKAAPSTEGLADEMASQPTSTDFLSNLSVRQVKGADGKVYRLPYIDGEGSMFRLPVNLIRMATQSSSLGADDLAQLQAGHMNVAYAKAAKQGTITGFKQYIDQNLEDLEKNKAETLKYNEPYLAALKTGKKELKTAYQIYAQDLKRARTLADEDVEKASEQFMQSTQKFADVQADILVRGVKAYSAQQLPQSLAVQTFNLQWMYPNVVTEQDIAQMNALQTQLVRANDEMLIKYFTALPKSLRTGQDAAALQKAALNRFAQQKAQLQAQVTQIQDRLYKAQHKINLENQWVETMSDIKEQLNEDMANMYPLGIEDYPEVKEKIDALFDTYLEEVYGLLITAQQNEAAQTLSEDENYQAFSYGVTRSLAKRNTAFAAIKRDLRAQGIKLFNQRPVRVQAQETPADSEYDY